MSGSKPTRAERGLATRARIVAAARQRFAADGYERATIRAIAADAGVDPSLVMRYYGNKQGLFVAAAEIELRIPDLGHLPRARAAVYHLLPHTLSRLCQCAPSLRAGARALPGAEEFPCRGRFHDGLDVLAEGRVGSLWFPEFADVDAGGRYGAIQAGIKGCVGAPRASARTPGVPFGWPGRGGKAS